MNLFKSKRTEKAPVPDADETTVVSVSPEDIPVPSVIDVPHVELSSNDKMKIREELRSDLNAAVAQLAIDNTPDRSEEQ